MGEVLLDLEDLIDDIKIFKTCFLLCENNFSIICGLSQLKKLGYDFFGYIIRLL